MALVKSQRNVKLQSEFKWPKDALNIVANTLSLQDSYDVNYMYNQIIRVISNDLERCSLHSTSFRCYLKEMTKSTFDNLDEMISRFIWQQKRPRGR